MTKTTDLKPRMNHPVMTHPDAMQALQALGKAAHNAVVPLKTLTLVELRASQINGCSVCVDMHSRDLRKLGETDDRLFAVAAWRDNPSFDGAERAALALAEALTRISDRADAVPDDIWAEATRHYDEKALATLLIAIANINAWNRLNVGVRQVVGIWKG
ncbi:MAG: carboxymuconolactone decarboxylase family protein [Bryobacteraceae bacterium]